MGNEEIQKLATLLNYWVDHNSEHSQEFKDWSEKMKDAGEEEIAGELLRAVEEMDRAGEYLEKAREKLAEKES